MNPSCWQGRKPQKLCEAAAGQAVGLCLPVEQRAWVQEEGAAFGTQLCTCKEKCLCCFFPTKFMGSHFNWPVNNQSAPHLLPVCPTALFRPSSLLPRFRGDGCCKSNACVCSKHLRCILWILLSFSKEPLQKLVTLFDCFSILKGE